MLSRKIKFPPKTNNELAKPKLQNRKKRWSEEEQRRKSLLELGEKLKIKKWEDWFA
jgi:hypothetical protein